VAYTEEEKEILDGRFVKLGKSTHCFRIAACWHRDRYTLVTHIPYECYQLPKETLITGLFIDTTQLRHSCVPTCFVRIDLRGVMTVHTIRPIFEGGELIKNTVNVYHSTVDFRVADLNARFGTTCACEAGDPTHHKFKKHDACRLAIYARSILVEDFCTRRDIIDYELVHADLYLRGSDLPHPNDPITIEGLRDAELALIKGLKGTCCESPELVCWYDTLIDRIQRRVVHVLDIDEERVRYWRIMMCHTIVCEKIKRPRNTRSGGRRARRRSWDQAGGFQELL
jgi:hypothetical protein